MKKSGLFTVLLMVLLISAVFIFSGCSNGENDDKGVSGDVGGIVTDAQTKQPLVGVTVTLGGQTTQTGDKGIYTFANVTEGQRNITGTMEGYQNYSSKVDVFAGEVTRKDFQMTPNSGPEPTPTPTVTSVSPDTARGGETVTVIGENFGETRTRAASTIKFNGVEATDITSWSDGEIQCRVPAMCNSGAVVVQVGGIDSNTDVLFTRNREWRGAAAINGDAIYNGAGIQLAVSSNGNAVAGFYINDTSQKLYAMIYNAADSTWSAPVRIDNGQEQNVDKLKLAMDANGNAFAIFKQYDTVSAYSLAYVNRYDASTGQWQTNPTVVNDTLGYSPDRPQIAVDGSGNAICIFTNNDGTTTRVYYNRYDASTGQWLAVPGLVDLNAGTNADRPELAVDENGNALCLFEKRDGVNYRIYSNYYNAGTDAWGTTLPTVDNGIAALADFKCRVGFDSAGNALAVFKQQSGAVYNIYANRYDPSANTWSGATILSDALFNADKPQLSVSPNGDAMCVYKQGDGVYNRVYAVYYSGLLGQWDTADRQIIDAGTGLAAEVGPVAMDLLSNAIAVFTQSNRIYGNYFQVENTTWLGADMFDTDEDTATSPQFSIDSAGNGVLIYKLNNGTDTQIYFNKYW